MTPKCDSTSDELIRTLRHYIRTPAGQPQGHLARRDEALAALRQLNDDELASALHAALGVEVGETPHAAQPGTIGTSSGGLVYPLSRAPVLLWLATATVAGAVVMGLEIVAFRLYAPYFGYSIYVWGTLISVVMLALAIGYAAGGRLADRSSSDVPLYGLVLASAAYQLVILFCVHPMLAALARGGDFVGPALATVLVFAPPMTALATVGPYVIRLLTRAGRFGTTAGKVYAVSTLGSVGGIMLTSFLLVPQFGTRWTMAGICAATALLGAAGLAYRRKGALFLLAPLAMLPGAPQAAWSADTHWVGESAYNLLRVVGPSHNLRLILNDELCVASRRNEQTGWTGGYYDDFSLGPLLTDARRVLVLGMGAGSSISATRAGSREAALLEFDAVEIDPLVVEVAYRFFGLQRDDPRVRVHVADARPWVAADDGEYDLVHVDLYQGGPYVPFYLITREFFADVHRRMGEDGLMMVNVLDMGAGKELLHASVATMGVVFPTVLVYSRPNGNHMVFAFRKERRLDDVRSALRDGAGGAGHLRVAEHARQVSAALRALVPDVETQVFTDDRAPVESVTRRMLADAR